MGWIPMNIKIMSKEDLNWSVWIKGIFASVIGGVSNAVVVVVVDPQTFLNNLEKLGQIAAGSAIISLALYLKQSPVPPPEEDTSVEIKK